MFQHIVIYAWHMSIFNIIGTEVNCEREFSKVKIVKSRLRSSLCHENLEALIIMSVEKQLLEDIKVSEVVEYLQNTSCVMSKMLPYIFIIIIMCLIQ